MSWSHLTDGDAKVKRLAQDPVGRKPGYREKLSLLVQRKPPQPSIFKKWVVSAGEPAFPPLISLGFLESLAYLAHASISTPRRVQLAFI